MCIVKIHQQTPGSPLKGMAADVCRVKSEENFKSMRLALYFKLFLSFTVWAACRKKKKLHAQSIGNNENMKDATVFGYIT